MVYCMYSASTECSFNLARLTSDARTGAKRGTIRDNFESKILIPPEEIKFIDLLFVRSW